MPSRLSRRADVDAMRRAPLAPVREQRGDLLGSDRPSTRARGGPARRLRTAAARPGGGAAPPSPGKKCGSRAATMPSTSASRRGGGRDASGSASTGRDRARCPGAPARIASTHRRPLARRRSRARRRPGRGTGPPSRPSCVRGRAALRVLARGDQRGEVVGLVPAALRPVGEDQEVHRRRRPSAHFASVAPHPNSMSSGCAPIASAISGTAQVSSRVISGRCRALGRSQRCDAARCRARGEVGGEVDVEAEGRSRTTRTARPTWRALAAWAPERAGP